MATSFAFPIVNVGELHSYREHAEMGRQAIRRLADRGYGTLLIELYRGLNPALQEFLNSRGKREDSIRFWAAYVKLEVECNYIEDSGSEAFNRATLALSPADREQAYLKRARRYPGCRSLQHFLSLAWAGKKKGMRVFLIDADPGKDYKVAASWYGNGGWIERKIRNQIMGEEIARHAVSLPKKGTLVITGAAHVGSNRENESSIGGELENQGINPADILSVVWGKNGIRSDHRDSLHQPIDAVACSADELVHWVEKKKMAKLLRCHAMQRALSRSETFTQNTASQSLGK